MGPDVRPHFAALARSKVWEGLYEGPRTAANISFRMRLARAVELLAPHAGKVLDLGCGPAPIAAKLVDRRFTYVGLDLSDEMLTRARLRAPGTRLVQGAVPLPFKDGAFDAVVALGFLEYVDTPSLALEEMWRVVRPGGRVVVSIPKRFHVDRLTVAALWPVRAVAAAIWGRRSDQIRRNLMTPRQLDRLASNCSLIPDGGSQYCYTLFPYPVTVLASRLSLRVNTWFERLPPPWLCSIFAQGYIGRYRRE